MNELNHFDDQGNARMVDVGGKSVTRRTATAQALVKMKKTTADLIKQAEIKKGDVLGVARLAGISATKWTPFLIPMCHTILVDSVDIIFAHQLVDETYSEIEVKAYVTSTGKTGVEMEALSAASMTALTIYDMCKSYDRSMEVRQLCLVEKTGGKSGQFLRDNFSVEEN